MASESAGRQLWGDVLRPVSVLRAARAGNTLWHKLGGRGSKRQKAAAHAAVYHIVAARYWWQLAAVASCPTAVGQHAGRASFLRSRVGCGARCVWFASGKTLPRPVLTWRERASR